MGAANEYSFYAEACFPTARDGRSFFQSYVRAAIPFLGYKLLPLLARNDIVRSVWTTNFDGLPARACAAVNVECLEIGIDTQHRTLTPSSRGALRAVSLHADYRYDELKNTATELQQQEAGLREALVRDAREYDLLVVGYSGRDRSLMAALCDAYSGQQSGRLYWCGMQIEPSAEVAELMAFAQLKGHEAFYVSTQGFDDLVERLALRILQNEDLQSAKDILSSVRADGVPTGRFAPISSVPTALVKSNAYPLIAPGEALKADLNFPDGTTPRRWLNEAMRGQQGAWIVTSTGGLFLATPSDIRQGTGGALVGSILTVRFSLDEIEADSKLLALMRLGLVRSVAQSLRLESNGRTIWESEEYTRKSLPQGSFLIHKALSFRLAFIKGQLHVLLTPEIVAKTPSGEFADQDSSKVLRNAVYGYQHNDVYDQDIRNVVRQSRG